MKSDPKAVSNPITIHYLPFTIHDLRFMIYETVRSRGREKTGAPLEIGHGFDDDIGMIFVGRDHLQQGCENYFAAFFV